MRPIPRRHAGRRLCGVLRKVHIARTHVPRDGQQHQLAVQGHAEHLRDDRTLCAAQHNWNARANLQGSGAGGVSAVQKWGSHHVGQGDADGRQLCGHGGAISVLDDPGGGQLSGTAVGGGCVCGRQGNCLGAGRWCGAHIGATDQAVCAENCGHQPEERTCGEDVRSDDVGELGVQIAVPRGGL